ncbi:hypothetical protein HYPDE_39403 [Hyphomicrobium denitrificans 1NES1]|uniref:Uncharacterized protein n=1 Tax=Hyphomicrobium denitrificans 1NES1 TaxID=670307 RepID=N0B7G0_9HYPH|nr:hypothetical protein HYPDE_39403 [Hyphomicrobium denitrificans 1NES1]
MVYLWSIVKFLHCVIERGIESINSAINIFSVANQTNNEQLRFRNCIDDTVVANAHAEEARLIAQLLYAGRSWGFFQPIKMCNEVFLNLTRKLF